MRITCSSSVARVGQPESPPKYRRIPPDLPYPIFTDPPETYVRFFSVKLTRFFGLAFGCLPEEYAPKKIRRRNGHRVSALMVFPTVLRTNPRLAIQGLRYVVRPPLSHFWEGTDYLHSKMMFDVSPSLLRFIKTVELTPFWVAEIGATLNAIEQMNRGTPLYLLKLREEFRRALDAANMDRNGRQGTKLAAG